MAVLTEEQSMLRDSARTWTQEKSPVSAFRKVRDAGGVLGYDPAAFAEMAEMGWTGVIIPEEFGGSEFGYLGLGLILEEMGRTLTASPILSSALAAASAKGLPERYRALALVLGGLVTLQASLGIATLMMRAPLDLSIAHQTGAALVLAAAVTFAWRSRRLS